MCEARKPIEEMTLPEVLDAIDKATAAFQKDYRATSYAGQARARKASRNLTHLLKQFRKLTVMGGSKDE